MPTNLQPVSQTSAIILSSTGSTDDVPSAVPFGMYTGSVEFITGAARQVNYVYKKLGGDVLDIELTEENIYAAYEESVLEYSYILNIHQGKNVLHNVLGDTTGTFDHHGNILPGTLSSSLDGTHVNLKYPRFDFSYSKRIAQAVSTETGLGGTKPFYSASFAAVTDQQDYDLAQIIQSASANDSTVPYYNKVGDNKITIRKVYYKTPQAMWRFYGYYGGLNTVGNLSTYGMYSDDSTFEVIPVWQNKSQAMAYEDAIKTRNSHYSYEIKDNNLRIFPSPVHNSPDNFWVDFTVDNDAWAQISGSTGVDREIEGINNLGTMPFGNVPYSNINAIGKQWIRRFGIALSKEMLGQVRGKFATIPIPGESVNLNAGELLTQAKEEQSALREELKTILDELTYAKLVQQEADMMQSSKDSLEKVPTGIFVG